MAEADDACARRIISDARRAGSAIERVRSLPQGSAQVTFEVRDTGPGLDPEHRERVFEAFYTTKEQGMGMGLAICRSIVGAHNGRLWATPNPGSGEVFTFSVPTRPT